MTYKLVLLPVGRFCERQSRYKAHPSRPIIFLHNFELGLCLIVV